MTTSEELNALYKEYNDNIRPLLALVEARTETFPVGILNEVRALHDHIGRTYLDKLNKEDKGHEIESARRHTWRITLDCYKILCMQGEVMLEQFEKDYHGVRLGEVDSGNFLPTLTASKDMARNLIHAAKMLEKDGRIEREAALDRFEEAVEAYEDMRQFISSQSQNLAWSASNQRRRAWRDILIALAIGCLSSWLVASYFNWLPALH